MLDRGRQTWARCSRPPNRPLVLLGRGRSKWAPVQGHPTGPSFCSTRVGTIMLPSSRLEFPRSSPELPGLNPERAISLDTYVKIGKILVSMVDFVREGVAIYKFVLTPLVQNRPPFYDVQPLSCKIDARPELPDDISVHSCRLEFALATF